MVRYGRRVNEPRPMGLRAQKKADRRAVIARAATRLFAKHGYMETSVAAIAREADVSLPTLFRYFPTKADILFDGADEVVDAWRLSMHSGPAGETLGAALRRATHAIVASTPERGSVALLRAELVPRDPELRRKALEIDGRVIGRLAEAIAEMLGVNANEDPRAFLVASCAMAAVRSAQHVLGHGRQHVKKRGFSAAIDEAFDALDGLGATLSREILNAPSTPAIRTRARSK